MPIRIAAVLPLLLAGFIAMPSLPLRAADPLPDLTKQTAYDGWVTVGYTQPGVAPQTIQTHPARRIYILNDHDGFTYTNFQQRTAARYLAELHAVYIGDLGTGDGQRYDFKAMGATAPQEFLEVLTHRHVPFTTERQATPKAIHLTLTLGPGEDSYLMSYQQALLEIDPATGRMQSLSIRKTLKAPMMMIARYHYDGPAGAERMEDLKLPPGTTVHDNRMPAEARTLLDRIDQRLDQDLGFNTAIVTSVRPRNGGPPGAGQVWLFSRRGDRWLEMTWYFFKKRGTNDPPTPQNWPDLSLVQLLDAVRDFPPYEYTVFDGRTLFENRSGEPRRDTVTAEEADTLRKKHSVAAMIWHGSASLLDTSAPELTTVKIAPVNGSCRRLRATHRSFDPKNPGQLRTQRVVTLVIEPRSLIPINYITEKFDDSAHGGGGDLFQTTYEMTPATSRNSLAIPTRWRKVNVADKPGPPEWLTLTPCPNAQLPDDWFTDPVQRLKLNNKAQSAKSISQ